VLATKASSLSLLLPSNAFPPSATTRSGMVGRMRAAAFGFAADLG
jgi:hypothetical protein